MLKVRYEIAFTSASLVVVLGSFSFYLQTFLLYALARVRQLAIPSAKVAGFHMEKFPLSNWHSSTAYCLVHSPFPFDENPRRPRSWDGYPNHYAYVDKVSDTPHLTLYHSASRFFEEPQSLISEGLMEPIEC